MTTVFQRIINGEIPAHRVYEDDQVLAFLDVQPLSRGHTLVIPKEPARSLHELSEESAAALGRVLPRLCRAVRDATGVPGYNVLQNNGEIANQGVMHVHFHIIPRYEDGSGLPLIWKGHELDAKEAESLARSIADRL